MEPTRWLDQKFTGVWRDCQAFRRARVSLTGWVEVWPLGSDDLKLKPCQRVAVHAGGREMGRHRAKPKLRRYEIITFKEQRPKFRPDFLGQVCAPGVVFGEALS